MKTIKQRFRRIFSLGGASSILQQTDAELITEDGYTFKVSKSILARSNEYFRALFCTFGKNRTQFRIPGINGECLSEILSYLYTGEFTWTERNITDIVTGADYLLVEGLYRFIRGKISENITVANCLPLLLFARLKNSEDISKEIFRFIQTHFDAVVFSHTSLIAELPLEVIKMFLSDKSLCIFSEMPMWCIIVQWVKKNVQERQFYIPYFLKLLAWKDIDENQAHEILNHTIVINNSYCRILNSYKYRNNYSSSLDVFQHFIQVHPNHLIDSISHRIPHRLYVIAKHLTPNEVYDYCEIYVTYDEKLDLWHKIEEVDFYPDHIISVQHYLYLFDFIGNRCIKYDLKEKKWVRMSNIRKERLAFTAFKFDRHIFLMGDIFNNKSGVIMYDIETYDSVADTWKDYKLLTSINNAESASASGFIYVVGCSYTSNSMIAMVCDIKSQRWAYLPSPTVFRHRFAFIAYREKLYIIAGSNQRGDLRSVEIFDTKSKSWNNAPDLPFSYNRAKAVVLNDQLYIFEEYPLGEENKKNVCWDRVENTWEEREGKGSFKDLHLHRFCVLEDPETIKIVSKENRYLNAALKKSGFN